MNTRLRVMRSPPVARPPGGRRWRVRDLLTVLRSLLVRAVVMAGGDGVRWGNYLGVPKHLAPVEGVPLLRRLVDQLAGRYVEVVVLAPTKDRRYRELRRPGVAVVDPAWTACDADKFLSALPWVHPAAPTAIVYGDVWLSEECVDVLLAARGCTFTGRANPSSITGCPWGELFAVTVDGAGADRLAASVLAVRRLLLSEQIRRGGGWEVYRHTQGLDLDPDAHAILADFADVDDWSDDFDYPEDYDRWTAARAARR